MSEYADLKHSIESIDAKVNRLLAWAEGDQRLGTPSVKQQIDKNSRDVVEVRRKAYSAVELIKENSNDIKTNTTEIKNIKRSGGLAGAGAGGVIAIIVETIRTLFQ